MTKQRIITNPVRLTGSVHPQQIASLVSIDALVRRLAALGEPSVIWELTTLAGDVAVQRAVQRAVAREGDDRDELGREGFAARAKRLEVEAENDLRRLLTDLRIQADLDKWAGDSDAVKRAARVAFVRLYEAGALFRTDAVLDSCPSCETVVDDADADSVELQVEQVRVSIPLTESSLEIDIAEPELIVGAVAVAVPAEHAPHDTAVQLPLLENEIPIIAVLDHMGIKRAHAYGVSMGGRVAQWLAIDRADRMGAVVLGACSSGGRHAVRRSKQATLAITTTPTGDPMTYQLLPLLVSPQWLHDNPWFAKDVDERHVQSTPPTARRLHYAASQAHDTWDLLPAIRLPVLVIHGDSDELNPPENAPLLAERIPDSELHLVRGGRHEYFVEFPDESNAVVLDFLHRHPL